jgi:hypothetical protein
MTNGMLRGGNSQHPFAFEIVVQKMLTGWLAPDLARNPACLFESFCKYFEKLRERNRFVKQSARSSQVAKCHEAGKQNVHRRL